MGAPMSVMNQRPGRELLEEIAQIMGISRAQAWRLRQDLAQRLESVARDWGTG